MAALVPLTWRFEDWCFFQKCSPTRGENLKYCKGEKSGHIPRSCICKCYKRAFAEFYFPKNFAKSLQGFAFFINNLKIFIGNVQSLISHHPKILQIHITIEQITCFGVVHWWIILFLYALNMYKWKNSGVHKGKLTLVFRFKSWVNHLVQ